MIRTERRPSRRDWEKWTKTRREGVLNEYRFLYPEEDILFKLHAIQPCTRRRLVEELCEPPDYLFVNTLINDLLSSGHIIKSKKGLYSISDEMEAICRCL